MIAVNKQKAHNAFTTYFYFLVFRLLLSLKFKLSGFTKNCLSAFLEIIGGAVTIALTALKNLIALIH